MNKQSNGIDKLEIAICLLTPILNIVLGIYYSLKHWEQEDEKPWIYILATGINLLMLKIVGGDGDVIALMCAMLLPLGIGLIIVKAFESNHNNNSKNYNNSNTSLKNNGELFNGFIKIYDDMTGQTGYRHPNGVCGFIFTSYNSIIDVTMVSSSTNKNKFNIGISFYFNYSILPGNAFSKMVTPLRFNNIIIRTDEHRYEINKQADITSQNASNSIRYNECCTILGITPTGWEMFEDIATSETVKIRFSGNTGMHDFIFDKKARRVVIDAYNVCKEKQDYIYFSSLDFAQDGITKLD